MRAKINMRENYTTKRIFFEKFHTFLVFLFSCSQQSTSSILLIELYLMILVAHPTPKQNKQIENSEVEKGGRVDNIIS